MSPSNATANKPHYRISRPVQGGGSAVTATPNAVANDSLLLAQIPDLDDVSAGTPPEGHSDGRLISQGISNKVVMGLGFVLVLFAILPFVLKKKGDSKPVVKELPAWSANGPAATGQPAPATTAQPAPSTPANNFYEANGAAPAAPAAYLTPQPQVGANRPMALSDPAWPQSNPAEANHGPADNRQPPPVDFRTGNTADYRQADQGTAAPIYQADARNNAAAGYRDYPNPNRADYRAEARTDNPNAMRGDNRSNPQRDYRGGYPGGGAVQGNPLIPSNGEGVSPSSYQDTQRVEPGVARFEGTIEKPPVGSTYDRPGTSTH